MFVQSYQFISEKARYFFIIGSSFDLNRLERKLPYLIVQSAHIFCRCFNTHVTHTLTTINLHCMCQQRHIKLLRRIFSFHRKRTPLNRFHLGDVSFWLKINKFEMPKSTSTWFLFWCVMAGDDS